MNDSTTLNDVLLLVGRMLLIVLFVASGIEKLLHFKTGLVEVNAKRIPLPALALTATIVLQLITGACIAAGHYVMWAALALAVFTLATAVVFYPYWSALPVEKAAMKNGFLEHVSIIGGCLLLIAAGPGKLVL
ncbi:MULTISPECIES: DoxX family protein [unclassified Stenotrophomonas]|uniref:DoxX family protein n=1 Tax=unclassified Stenotrophomonas TaxID=196198 RepID=UPI000D16CB6E|nr:MULTISPECIES: DoxX family protein [unclassified Stenotrophomonas]PTA70679.1 DoxX family protein [Stenotrophomonas sp. Nf1]PTA81253.1 DoxX family protein [Stenotrophomonas sp. Nf4]